MLIYIIYKKLVLIAASLRKTHTGTSFASVTSVPCDWVLM